VGPKTSVEVLQEKKSLALSGIQTLYCPATNLGYIVVAVVVVVVVVVVVGSC
jgi:hypothetical protein